MSAQPASWRGELSSAVSFLTPFGRASSPTTETMNWFPLVGAGVGALLGVLRSIVARRSSAATTGVVFALGDVALTGALHLDGLADAADGLFAHGGRASRLEIMSDPHVGSYGTVALVMALCRRAAAVSRERPRPSSIVAVYALSRSAMVVTTRLLPYAREQGLASPFLARQGGFDQAGQVASTSIAVALVVLWRAEGLRGLVAGFAGCTAAAGLALLAKRRVGGFTGDVLGAISVVSETVALSVLARP